MIPELKLPRSRGSTVPVQRGRLMFPSDIREDIFGGRRSESWIRRYFAPECKIRIGHSTVGWFENDAYNWLESRKGLT